MTSLVKGSSAVVNISKSADVVVVVVVVVVDFNLLEEVSIPALVKSLLRSVGNGSNKEIFQPYRQMVRAMRRNPFQLPA